MSDDNRMVIEGDGGIPLPSAQGPLKEALHITSKAKARFPEHQTGPYARASRLVRESLEAGVEIDKVVGMVYLETGLRLKSEWEGICEIQVATFAQEAIFTSVEAEAPDENLELFVRALDHLGVSVVGSTPRVEPSREKAFRNINAEILTLSKTRNLHADFHVDYNLDANGTAGHKRVTIGHATRLGMFSAEEWMTLENQLEVLPLKICPPQSDPYMMGRPCEDGTRTVPPGLRTLAVARIRRQHGIYIAMSVNNVENAFAPQTTSICSPWQPPFDRTSVPGGRVAATCRALRWTTLKC
ncbi:hypothetical protein PISMIDRAFT_28293 [Pisolithus microcarpus 441]|uniref:Adenosine deaminase n=1 Tax=Pisolithus microcarpus 441 TaxID=765257 RepID=A0A0C9ZBK8_9AGAM|nr:hypothetical protein PISMIDRAFT_28293 [Pisolithus microcarpus 441]